jgi:hypothetical protein
MKQWPTTNVCLLTSFLSKLRFAKFFGRAISQDHKQEPSFDLFSPTRMKDTSQCGGRAVKFGPNFHLAQGWAKFLLTPSNKKITAAVDWRGTTKNTQKESCQSIFSQKAPIVKYVPQRKQANEASTQPSEVFSVLLSVWFTVLHYVFRK